MPTETAIRVEVAGEASGLAGPAGLRLPADARLADALAALGVSESEGEFGIWGRRVALDTRLCDGDRIECYRPLAADPKAARRARAKR
ncbi:MAG: RnfH family protein [Gammaproteobacteria bacterium]